LVFFLIRAGRQLIFPSTCCSFLRRFLATPGMALAWAPACAAAQTAAIPETPGVPGGAVLQMLFGLALVVGVLILGAYLLRRFNGGRAFGNNGALRVVGGLILGPRERIVLLEVGETWLVVGVVPGQIKTLHTLPKGELPTGADAENRFGNWLKQVVER
jgi:flagellar protein FliO/FliZ